MRWPASCTSGVRFLGSPIRPILMISTAHKTNGKTNGRSNGKAMRFRALSELLEHFSRWVTNWSGSSWAFTLALAVVVVWAITGPIFHYSDTWQLVINTGTTIVTFLMV